MINLDIFSREIDLVNQLITKKSLHILFAGNGRPKFVINEYYLKEECSKNSIDYKHFHKTLNLELPFIIYSQLSGEMIEQFSHIFDDEDEDIIRQKVRIVNDKLINQDYKIKYLIKATSKNSTLNSLNWEICKKIFDDDEGELPNIKYSTLKLYLQEEKGDSSLLYSFFGKGDTSVTLTLDSSDIEYFMQCLTSIKNALDDTKKEED